MQLFASLQQAQFKAAWLAIGMFDGVHLGHQKILKEMSAGARSQGVPALALTFSPHPVEVLRAPVESFYLCDPKEKEDLIAALGVDALITQTFDWDFSQTRAHDFVRQLKQRLGLQRLFLGEDFALGHNREGDVPTLQRFGGEMDFELEVFPAVEVDGAAISSSRIRALLREGNMEGVGRLLGRNYALSGEVVHGAGRGGSIGIPTANLDIWDKRALPAWGIYVSRAELRGQSWGAVTSIGVRPTFDDNLDAPVVETLLLDYEGEDFYGERLRVEFLTRLRGEEKFAGVEALLAQVEEDIVRGRQFLANA